jgi:hypothetical protein
VVQPRNSDIGGYHIAFYVGDITAVADDLHAKNVKTMMGPIPITEGPAAGQVIVYFNAPWGSSWRRSPIRRAWPTRRTRRRFFGRRRTRLSKAYLFHYTNMDFFPTRQWGHDARSVELFGFSWLAGFSMRKSRFMTVGFVWISLDSLVRIETYQCVTRDFC